MKCSDVSVSHGDTAEPIFRISDFEHGAHGGWTPRNNSDGENGDQRLVSCMGNFVEALLMADGGRFDIIG